LNYVTSARFIAQERALVEWSQLQLFKAKKKKRLFTKGFGLYKYSKILEFCHSTPPMLAALVHVTT
jgi:hypothetical protein